MRVALDATYTVDAQPSGIAVYSRELLNGLGAFHRDDEFLFCYRPKQFRRAAQPLLPNVRRKVLFSRMPTFRADIFHALNQRLDRQYAPKTVATFHDLFVLTGEYSTPEFRKRFAHQARRAAERASLILTVSQFTADQVAGLLHVERTRIRVIPHGVKQPGAIPREHREPFVLFVGALQARKNVGRLIEAFAALPAPWRLILAGAPSGYRADEILAQIAHSPHRARIEVTGYVSREKLDDLYARASIFAFPSLDEGFGIPVLEAMAWSVPVVTSNTSALREVAGNAALTVDPADVEQISGALGQLARDGELRQKLTSLGRERASKFTWEETVRKTYAVYGEL